MKLYVWNDPYSVPYGMSLFFAVADSVDQARRIALDAAAFKGGLHYPESTPVITLGEPDRIMDLPCGEWHEWSE